MLKNELEMMKIFILYCMLALLITLYNTFCHNISNRRMYAKVSGQYLNMIGCDGVS